MKTKSPTIVSRSMNLPLVAADVSRRIPTPSCPPPYVGSYTVRGRFMGSMRASLRVILAPLLALTLQAQPTAPRTNGPPANPERLPPDARVLRNLEYVPGGHERQKLDLCLPAQTNRSLPLIIWVHGGAWLGGSKNDCPARPYVARGYAVASVGYRLSQHAVFSAQIEDCKAAVRWLRAHAKEYGLDPDRFGAWGSSSGGHLVALLGTTGDVKEFDVGQDRDVSSRVQAVVDFFGPTDLLQMDAQAGPNSRMKHDAPDSPESRLIGGTLQQNKEKAARANPIRYVSQGDPPMLIVHGDSDPLVPYQQSEIFYEALKKAGVEAELHLVKGGGHGTGFGPEVNRMVEAFFEGRLKNIPASDGLK